MTTRLIRAAGLLSLLLIVAAPAARAATPKEIDESIKRGARALKARFSGAQGAPQDQSQGIGPMALAGLALLEAKVPITDPVVKSITDQVREASYKQNRTYQIALCLMYLDRYGEPKDEPLIQLLAVRLIVGQTKDGGWTYDCLAPIPPADEQRLRAVLKESAPVTGSGGGKETPKMHPEVEKYGQTLLAARQQAGAAGTAQSGDNSNTQFGVMAIWMSRKHGVPVESALEQIENRFLSTQDPQTGNWSYVGGTVGPSKAGVAAGSPAMYGSGLLGLATALARREERRQKKATLTANSKSDSTGKHSDPFYNPPAGTPPPKGARPPSDVRDQAVALAIAGLEATLLESLRGDGLLSSRHVGRHGYGDFYFLWCLERVGVTYGLDKIGRSGIDWYEHGSTAVIRCQSPDGIWNQGGYTAEINSSFALLFLCKANLARDLSSKVQKDPSSTEMRAGTSQAATVEVQPNRPSAASEVGSTSIPTPIELPNPSGDAAITLASIMLKSTGGDWSKRLLEARDGKGQTFTRALVMIADKASGERKKEARDALAERLCRMTAATLRSMLSASEAELRRAAALACAMKDDKDHIPDLIAALGDAEEPVVRAAKAGLKSLTGKDFGPAVGASAAEKTAAVAAWREWYSKVKK